MRLRVQVKASQPRDQIWWDGEQLICRVTAIPQKGQSNRHLVGLLAEQFGLAPSLIRIESGHTSHFKTVNFDSDEAQIRQVLTNLPRVSAQSKLF